MDFISYRNAVQNLESELKIKSNKQHEIQNLKDQIAAKDKIIKELNLFKVKYETLQNLQIKKEKEIESLKKVNMDQEGVIKKQEIKLTELHNENHSKNIIFQDQSKIKERLHVVCQDLNNLKKKSIENQEEFVSFIKKSDKDKSALEAKKNNHEEIVQQLRKEIKSQAERYKNVSDENKVIKKQLAINDKMIRNLERECRSTSDIIDQNLELTKEKEDLRSKLEEECTKRKLEEELGNFEIQAKKLKQDCEVLRKSEEKNAESIQSKDEAIKKKNRIIERQKGNLKLMLDEIRKTKINCL